MTKKVLSLLLCLVMVLGMIPLQAHAADQVSPLELSQISVRNLENGKRAETELRISNGNQTKISGEIILAAYDAATNVMLNYKIQSVQVGGDSHLNWKGSVDLPQSGSFTVKAFLWDSLDSMNLLSNVLLIGNPAAKTGTVTLSVEKKAIGKEPVIAPVEVDLLEGDTAWSVIKRNLDANGITYRYTNGQWGVYVNTIAGDGEMDHGSMSGWVYFVNNAMPNVGMSAYQPVSGDVIRLCYSTNFGLDVDTPVDIPAADATPASWENDIWLNSDFESLKPGETYEIYARRLPELVKDGISNEGITLPPMHYNVISGKDVVSVDEKGVVTAKQDGVAVIQVYYDEVKPEWSDKTFPACDPVNYAYMTVEVNSNPSSMEITTDLDQLNAADGVYHTKGTTYDTVYFTEGTSVPYSFHVEAKDAATLRVTCNGEVLSGTKGNYTANLKSCTNVILVEAQDANYKTRRVAYSVDARKIEIKVDNLSRPGENIITGDRVAVSFKGIVIPVSKLATLYNPCMNAWGGKSAGVQYTVDGKEVFGRCDQYNLATKNTIEMTMDKQGTYSFTNGCIDISWWGSALDAHKGTTRPGDPNLNAATKLAKMCTMPDFTIVVEEPNAEQKAVQNVGNLIAEIGKVTASSGAKITAARDAYNALSPELQQQVSNYQVLQDAEKAYEQAKGDQAKATAVDTMIQKSCIPPTKVNLGSEANVKAARDAYNALTEAQKKLVKKLTFLNIAEKKLNGLRTTAAEKAKAVDDKITAIGNVTLESASKIRDARNSYNALDQYQKKYVTKYSELQRAEAQLNELQKPLTETADKIKMAAAVMEAKQWNAQIQQAVLDARSSFNGLTAQQQMVLDMEKDLQAFEMQLLKLQLDAIYADGTVTGEDVDLIRDARSLLDTMSEAQKSQVTQQQKGLEDAEAQLPKIMDQYAVHKIKVIAQFKPGTPEFDAAVLEARKVYNSLTEEQKAGAADMLQDLEGAEVEYTAEKIKALTGCEPGTSQFEQTISAARSMVNTMNKKQKDAVADLMPELEAAEEKLRSYLSRTITLSLEQDNYYSAAPAQVVIPANLSDKYGYVDQVTDGVSVLDALIKVHEILLADSFAPGATAGILDVSETGFITAIMGEATSNFGFAVNGMMPNDGVINPAYGTFTGYSSNQARLLNGDILQFFFYNPDGYYGEIYTNFCQGEKHVTELSAAVNEKLNVTVKGYSYMYEGCNKEIRWKPVTDMPICILEKDSETTGGLTPMGILTDTETGAAEISFSEPGTYYLAVTSDPEMMTYVIPQLCKVTVS